MKRATKFLFAAAVATLFAGTATAQVAPAGSGDTVAVHADRPGATYDRHIFGQFAEHLAPASIRASGWARAARSPTSTAIAAT